MHLLEIVLLVFAFVLFVIAAATAHRFSHWPSLVAAGLAFWVLEVLIVLAKP